MQQQKPHTILIVDDNPLFVSALEALILDVANFPIKRVDKAYNGFDGLNLIRTQSYHLIFMDINLPGINGIQVTKTADWELYRKGLNIIAISFHTEEEYMIEMLCAGARYYLPKDQINAETIAEILNV